MEDPINREQQSKNETQADSVALDILRPTLELIGESNYLSEQERVEQVDLKRYFKRTAFSTTLRLHSELYDDPTTSFDLTADHFPDNQDKLILDAESRIGKHKVEKWALFVTDNGIFYYWTDMHSTALGLTATEIIYACRLNQTVLTPTTIQIWNNPYINVAGRPTRISHTWNRVPEQIFPLESLRGNLLRPHIKISNFGEIITASYNGYYGYPDSVNPGLSFSPETSPSLDEIGAIYFPYENEPILKIGVEPEREVNDLFSATLEEFTKSLKIERKY